MTDPPKRAEVVVEGTSTGTFRVLVEHIPAVVNISAVDEQSSTVYISPQVEELLGYRPDEWIADPGLWRRALHPEDRDRIVQRHLRHIERGGGWAEEYRMVARDGRTVWIREHAVIVRDDDRGAAFEQGVWLDVTDRKQAEEELVESYRTLQRSDEDRRRLLASLVTAQEQERRRIARDLHDEALQQLAATLLQVEAATFGGGPLDAVAAGELKANLRLVIEALRDVLFETLPPVLDEGGLAEAIETYLAHTTGGDLRFRISNELTTEPAPELRTVAYRVVQEAVTNVRKHARAHGLVVSMVEHAGGMLIRVQDDGVGFTPADAARLAPTHIGLLTMRERAELAGGWLEVDSTPGEGTAVTFWLPLVGDVVRVLDPVSPAGRLSG